MAQIKKPFRTDAFLSLTDLTPTFLEVAGRPTENNITGQSLLTLLLTGKTSARHDRSQVFFGKERHVPGQESGDWGGYHMRAIRTYDYLYIRNLRPDRWPAGTPHFEKATLYPSWYGDVDNSPTKRYMINHNDDNVLNTLLFTMAFEKRPAEELYDLKRDPYQLNNLAGNKAYAEIQQRLSQQLTDELKATGDPRVKGAAEFFENYPYTGGTPKPVNYKKKKNNHKTV